jgi:hypothetical protein
MAMKIAMTETGDESRVVSEGKPTGATHKPTETAWTK